MAQNGQNDGSQIQDRAVRYAEAATAGDQMSQQNRTLISQLRSGLHYPLVREASSVHTTHTTVHDVNKVAFAELDSHADTVVAGSTCKVLELTEKSSDVYPYADSYEPIKNVPVAKVATAYDHPLGETFIIILGMHCTWGRVLNILSSVQIRPEPMGS
jgi:hypothetical protein